MTAKAAASATTFAKPNTTVSTTLQLLKLPAFALAPKGHCLRVEKCYQRLQRAAAAHDTMGQSTPPT
jgi:hypothetical protein